MVTPEDLGLELYGACSSCHQVHPIRRNTEVSDADFEDELVLPDEWDHVELYVMKSHLMFGNHGPECSGVGEVPQAILGD